jgi:tetratricopeptide (TPR) repeat protein
VQLLEQLVRDSTATDDRPYVLGAKLILANELGDVERMKDAEDVLASIEQPMKRLYGEKSLAMANWKNSMAATLSVDKRAEEAIPLYREALALDVELGGPETPEVANTTFNLADAEAATGAWDKAEADFRRSIDLAAKIYPDPNSNVEIFRVSYAMMLNKLHRFADAEIVLKQVIARADRDATFKDNEVYRVAQLCIALADFGLDPTPQHRLAFAQFAKLPDDATRNEREAHDEQVALARSLGLL